MKASLTLCVLACASLLAACGDSGFSGGNGQKRVEAARNGGDGAAAHGDEDATRAGRAGKGGADATDGDDDAGDDYAEGHEGSPDGPAGATPEQKAIARCLAAWGSHPFGDDAFQSFRQIHAAVSILGGGGYVVEDTVRTDRPALILVHAAVSVLGRSDYLLMNPNGWYCIKTNVNVMTKSTFELQCDAKLADARVQVNVMSKAQGTAGVGVNVLSDVKVERKRDANAPGC